MNHLLTYGENSNYQNGMQHLRFDIDDGFITKDGAIQKALQPFFLKWQDNKYQGPVIPNEYSGFNNTATTISSVGESISGFVKGLISGTTKKLHGANKSSISAAAGDPSGINEMNSNLIPNWVTPLQTLNEASNPNEEDSVYVVEEDCIDSHTRGLMSAIAERFPKLVLKYIEAGANVNAIIDKDEGLAPANVVTPLSSAVYNLDYDSIKILLTNHAHPNLKIPGNKSLIEYLIRGMIAIDLEEQSGKPRQQPLILFGQKMPIRTNLTISKKTINNAERILDLLFCYGLSSEFEWTEEFKQLLQHMKSQVDNCMGIFLGMMNAVMPDKITCSVDNERQDTIIFKILEDEFWLFAHESSIKLLQKKLSHQIGFCTHTPRLPQITQEAAAIINQEKEAVLIEYKKHLTCFNFMCAWPDVLTDLIIQYATSGSNEVAEKHQSQQSKVTFWKTEEEHKAEFKKENELHENFLKHLIVTKALKTTLGENNHKLVVEYLVESPSCGRI